LISFNYIESEETGNPKRQLKQKLHVQITKSVRIMNTKRKLIQKDEKSISILQIIGFVLIVIGVSSLLISLTPVYSLKGNSVSVLFFIIMLGVAFAFPSLLKDQNKGLSTMRITVFMMTNVICMLLLKIGWSDDITSLEQIGLNEYWMGLIAFIFGAKAAQTFFENWKQSTKDSQKSNDNSNVNAITLSGQQTAQLAINDNEEKLKNAYPNIVKLIPSYCLEGSNRIPCVDICISDNAKQKIPSFLNYVNTNGLSSQIKTRVITNFENVKPQLGRGDFIANISTPMYLGSVGCIVSDGSNKLYVLTSNHVMTNNYFIDPGDLGSKAVELKYGNYLNIGTWSYGKMDNTVDAALITIEHTNTDSNDLNNLIYDVTDEADSSLTIVEFKGAKSHTKLGYVIHVNQHIDVDYRNKTVELNGLITISADTNVFSPISQEGDSGALVYTQDQKQPIGIVLGANSQFTYVIPIRTVLKAFSDLNLTIINN
jgi:hypothetical protein